MKLFIAQALSKGGDKASAKVLVERSKMLMAKVQPQVKEALTKTYADLLAELLRD